MRVLAWSIVRLGFLVLAGCTAVDEFSPRAITYNLAAERAQNQALLLNVVRSSLRRPMQFTTVQSVTGTASESGSVQLALPFGSRTSLSPSSVQLIGTASGGPSFAVAVLDTQEFYQGISHPIKPQVIDFLLSEGYPKSLIFYLLTNAIEVVADQGQPLKLRSYPGDDQEFEPFQRTMDFLIRLGLTTKSQIATTGYGPELTHAEAVKLVVGAPNAALDLEKVNGTDAYQIKKSQPEYSLCFDPLPQFVKFIDPGSLCSSKTPFNPAERGHVKLSSGGIAELRREQPPGFPAHVHSIILYPRSVEAIIYFLGEVVRRHLSPAAGVSPRVIQIMIGPSSAPMPGSGCGNRDDGISTRKNADYSCQSLFFVEKGVNPAARDLSVGYLDNVYWLQQDQPKTGWSLPTLALVRELLALNTSAKELPATSTLSIVAP